MTREELAGWVFIIALWVALLLVGFVVTLISAAVLGYVAYWIFMVAALGFKAADHQVCRWTGMKSPFD